MNTSALKFGVAGLCVSSQSQTGIRFKEGKISNRSSNQPASGASERKQPEFFNAKARPIFFTPPFSRRGQLLWRRRTICDQRVKLILRHIFRILYYERDLLQGIRFFRNLPLFFATEHSHRVVGNRNISTRFKSRMRPRDLFCRDSENGQRRLLTIEEAP